MVKEQERKTEKTPETRLFPEKSRIIPEKEIKKLMKPVALLVFIKRVFAQIYTEPYHLPNIKNLITELYKHIFHKIKTKLHNF